MFKNFTYFYLFILISALFYACNSTGYEIEDEQTEAPKTETKTEIKQDVEQPKTDLQQDLDKQRPGKETMSNKQFTIQLGAFSEESNAKKFIEKVRKILKIDVNYIFLNGLYKVRTNAFNSIDEAINTLEIVQTAGYLDPFITELNK
jgi:septal ring-binding cell division protein DamX